MTVTDPAGNIITVDPTATLGDGSANAPAGTPQLPNLLNGYKDPPPWEVAGVDYAVGIPSGTVLKNPATISMAGVTVDTSNDTVYVTGNNVTLNGYDFSLNGGWEVYIEDGASNTLIENSNFLVGSNDRKSNSKHHRCIKSHRCGLRIQRWRSKRAQRERAYLFSGFWNVRF